MAEPEPRQLKMRGWLKSSPDLQWLSKSTGISVPMLHAHYEAASPGFKSPLFIGYIIFLAAMMLTWLPRGWHERQLQTDIESSYSYWGVHSMVTGLFLAFIILGPALMCIGTIGRSKRTQSGFWARIDGSLCPKCDAALAHAPANEAGLVECPKCRNTYAESDVRPLATGNGGG